MPLPRLGLGGTMEFVIALAAEYSIVRSSVSVLIVVFAAAATYMIVSGHGRIAPQNSVRWGIFLFLGVIAVGYAACFGGRQLRQLFGLQPVVYLSVACLMLCLPVGLMGWIRRKHTSGEQGGTNTE